MKIGTCSALHGWDDAKMTHSGLTIRGRSTGCGRIVYWLPLESRRVVPTKRGGDPAAGPAASDESTSSTSGSHGCLCGQIVTP